jgi:hypothetical protein
MASSATEIANLAISHLGIGKTIANLETEKSQEANACRRFYNTIRDSTLRDFPWPFAGKTAALALIEENPTTEWTYSYRYPTDCLKARRILSGNRNDTRQSEVVYKIFYSATGTVIYTDMKDAELEYTVLIDDPIRYPANFSLAFSLRLATYIAPQLTAGDPFKMGEQSFRRYQMELAMAQSSSLNEEQPDQEPESEFIRARA